MRLFLSVALLSFTSSVYASNITVSGSVFGNWAADTVFVNGDLQVPIGQTLTVQAGCKVLFNGYYSLQIEGQFTAVGTSESPIIFRAKDTTGFRGEGSAGSWAGIIVRNLSSAPAIFKHCEFQYLKTGLGMRLEYAHSKFLYCKFFNNRTQRLIYIWNYDNEIRNCIISRNAASSMIQIAGRPYDTIRIENNTIVNNAGYAVNYDGYVRSACILSNNIIWNNNAGSAGEIYYQRYSYEGFDTSAMILRNCIIKNGSQLPYYNNSCSEKYPLFTDTAALDFSVQWRNFPHNDTTKSGAIDGGHHLTPRDADSTRADIGALAYHRVDGTSLTWASFSMDTIVGYQNNHTVRFTNLSHRPHAGTSWSWNFGDGNTSNAVHPVHTFTTSGNFTIKLVAADPGGHKDSLVLVGAVKVFPGTKVNGGEVSGIWEMSKSPYYVYGNLFVGAEKRLEIKPGTVVQFMGQYNLDVYGNLVAKGTKNDSVRFEAYDTTGMRLYKEMNIDFPFANFQRHRGWGGIHAVSNPSRSDSCILEYCKISDVRIGNPNAQYRGGLKLHHVKTAQVRHSLFINNFLTVNNYIEGSDTAASIYHVAGIGGVGTSAVIEDNRFENLYQFGPAAIFLVRADSAVIKRNVFYKVTNAGVALQRIRRYIFSDNILDSIDGIGLRLQDLEAAAGRTTINEIKGNIFSNSRRGINAGALHKTRFSQNIFKNNRDQIDVALYIWGDSLYVSNNLFLNNRVTQTISNVGGTCMHIILTRSGTGVVANNTLVDNYGFASFQAIIYADDRLQLYNNILWNKSGVELQATKFTTSWFFSTFKDSRNNTVKGGYAQGSGNFNEPPQFKDSLAGNYGLRITSKCINKGYPDTAGLLLPSTDFFGSARIDTFSNIIDVGMAEYMNTRPDAAAISNDSLSENLAPMSFVGKFVTTDADAGDVHTYSFTTVAGVPNNNSQFLIRNDSLFSLASFSFAGGNKNVSVRAKDLLGGFIENSFTIFIRQNTITALPQINDVQKEFRIFPNPVYRLLTIKPLYNSKGHWSLLTTMGQELLSGTYNNLTQVRLGGLVSGSYLLKINDGKKTYIMTLLKL